MNGVPLTDSFDAAIGSDMQSNWCKESVLHAVSFQASQPPRFKDRRLVRMSLDAAKLMPFAKAEVGRFALKAWRGLLRLGLLAGHRTSRSKQDALPMLDLLVQPSRVVGGTLGVRRRARYLRVAASNEITCSCGGPPLCSSLFG